MPQHDIRAELAPRDIVARAIDFEMKKHGIDCVHLDISHQPLAFIQEHFPNIYARCLELGIDISKQPIPVVPAAHYTCGGIHTDLHGRTDLVGLHADWRDGLHRPARRQPAGQQFAGGMHGVRPRRRFGHPAVPHAAPPVLPAWDDSRVTDADEAVVISHNWDELRRFMWDYVGIVRTNKRLERAAHRIALLQGEIHEFYAHFHVTRDLLELRNLVQVADLIVRWSASGHCQSARVATKAGACTTAWIGTRHANVTSWKDVCRIADDTASRALASCASVASHCATMLAVWAIWDNSNDALASFMGYAYCN
jgi:L-aspartate oxidase